MKRDVRLHGLTSDHHHALVLARKIRKALEAGPVEPSFARMVAERFRTELRPHFRVEGDLLLPPLEKAGESAKVARTLSEHKELRDLVSDAARGDRGSLQRFASRLEAHVRFEEQELFPACERLLDDSILDAVASRATKR